MAAGRSYASGGAPERVEAMTPPEQVQSSDGTRIAFRRSGNGDPVLFVHGSCTSSADWAFARPLLEGDFTVVTMDRRGRGESGDGPDYAMEREPEDILAVLDAVGAEMLVAHSYGGLCATLAVQRTDRLRLRRPRRAAPRGHPAGSPGR